ncbi:MAG: MBL fold metallo-hydrolase [Akkermansiaceae bacterium]|nr:MBL fold metallo-hydrolase [Verrucomicrobiales bacterium]
MRFHGEAFRGGLRLFASNPRCLLRGTRYGVNCPANLKSILRPPLNSKAFSRRRFLTVGSLGLCGAWAGASEILPARLLRGFIAENRRDLLNCAGLPMPALWNPNTITAAWLGHASVLINFHGVTILTDPVLFNRIGADTPFGTIGPKRLIQPGLAPAQLPHIDLVLLSHAHMDHLDPATLRCLPATTKAVTARSTKDLLGDMKFKEPKELAWGEKTMVTTANGEVEIEAFEVNHWGSRWKYDQKRGYNGYVISRGGKKIIFGGDTAWSDSFGKLRSKGPFEMAIMPIGAYDPWIFAHCSPEQAVKMANQAGAKYFLPVHFNTFAFGREGTVEPIERMEAAIEAERIAWRSVGETFCLDRQFKPVAELA